MINCTNIWIFLKINECILSLWVAVNSCSTIVARCTSFKCALRKISDKLKKKNEKKKTLVRLSFISRVHVDLCLLATTVKIR